MNENETRRAAAVEGATRATRLEVLAADSDDPAVGQALAAAAADAAAFRDALLLLVLADERDALADLATEDLRAALATVERQRNELHGGPRSADSPDPERVAAEIAVLEARIGGARYLLAERSAGPPPALRPIAVPGGPVSRPTQVAGTPAPPNRQVPGRAPSGPDPSEGPVTALAPDRLSRLRLPVGLPQALSVAAAGIALMVVLGLRGSG